MKYTPGCFFLFNVLIGLMACNNMKTNPEAVKHFENIKTFEGQWFGTYDEGEFNLRLRALNDTVISGYFYLMRFADTAVTNTYHISIKSNDVMLKIISYSFITNQRKEFNYIVSGSSPDEIRFEGLAGVSPKVYLLKKVNNDSIMQVFPGTDGDLPGDSDTLLYGYSRVL